MKSTNGQPQAIWKNVWTLAEQKGEKLHPVSFELLGRGRALADARGSDLCTIVIGSQVSPADLQELFERGADCVYLVDYPELKHFLVEPYANVLNILIDNYHPEILVAAATTTGRTLMPYLSAQIHAGLTADCTGLEIEAETGLLLQTRPAIGGNILATIKTPTARPQMATVRPKSTRIPERQLDRTGKIVRIEFLEKIFSSRVKFESFIPDDSNASSIEDADIVIAGGAGVKTAEGFTLINKLAECLSGAVGASRPCVDHGWQPYAHQVGLSGKTVSPRLYVACGISGAIQHLAGIQTAESIIAINSDPNAPIFQLADLGIVGNMFDLLPELIEKVEQNYSTDKNQTNK
jgi:electron transfer flavoprotein alpha subunit